MVQRDRNGQRLPHPGMRQASQSSEIGRLSLMRRLTLSRLSRQRRVDYLFTPYVSRVILQSSANVPSRNRPDAGGPASGPRTGIRSSSSSTQPAMPPISSTVNRPTLQTTSLPSPTPFNPNAPLCSRPLLRPMSTGCRSSSTRSIGSRRLPAGYPLPGGLLSRAPQRSTSSAASPPETGGSPNVHSSSP